MSDDNQTSFKTDERLSSLLRDRNLRLQQPAQLISNLGTWIHRTALIWFMWHLTGSGLWIGLLVAAEIIPLLLLAPFSGAIVDRYGGICANYISLIGMTVVCAALFLTVLLGFHPPIWLVLFNLAMGIFVALNGPAWQDMISMIYPRSQVPRVVSMSSFNFNIGRMTGPIISLLVIEKWGIAAAFGINALSCLPPVWANSRYLIVNPKGTGKTASRMMDEVGAGWRYMRADPFIASIILMMLATSLLGRPFMDMFPAAADLLFNRKDDGPMLLLSATGFGALFAGFGLAIIGFHPWLYRWPKISTYLLATSIFGMMLVPTLIMALPFAALAGFAMVSNALASTSLLQHNTDPLYRGRIMAFYFLTFRGGMALGALLAGLLTDLWRIDGALIAAAALMVLLAWRGFDPIQGNERIKL